MALVPEQGSGRLTAVLLFAITVILVYLLCFHWFILKHLDYGEEISGLEEQLGRFERIAAQKGEYETLLSDLEGRRSDESLFLEGDDFNEAAAGMSEQLNQMVQTQAEDACQIVSRQPVRPRVEERFQRVTVNARMRCSIDDLTTRAESGPGGLSLAFRYALRIPRIKRQHAWNWERCRD